jgi:hypothetical protein
LNTKRKIFIKGEFCLVKGKAFGTGEKSSNLENASLKSYSFTFDYLQKDFDKDLQKEFAKTKHVVQAWSKNVKNKGYLELSQYNYS